MASQKTVVVAMGAFALALVGAGLFFVLGSDPGSGGGKSDEPDVAAEGPSKPAEDGAQAPRAKKQKKGTAGVFGVLKLKKDESPAADRTVVLTSEGVEPWTCVTDAKGAFRFGELPHGEVYELRIESEGFATVRLPGIGLDREEQRDLGTLWLDVAVSMTVYVKNFRDEPLAGAEVLAFANSTGNVDWSQRLAQIGVQPVAVEKLTTDAEGKAFFPELATGSWTFTAAKEGYAQDGKTAPELSSKVDPKPLTIYLGTAFRLAGKVLDGSEQPIAGALVMASPSGNWWSPASGPLSARVTADDQGHYTFDRLPAGNTQLWAARPGGIPAPVATLRVPPVDEYDLRLIAGGVLKGKVTLHGGTEPVGDATVRATGWSNGGSRVAEATTDAEGNYVIDTLLEGMINSLTVQKKGFAQYSEPNQQWQQIPINRDDTIERNLEMEKAAKLTGVVSGPDGPLQGALVNTFTMRKGGMGWDQKNTTTDAKGHYEFPGVMQGKTLLQVTKAGFYQKGYPQNAWMALQQGTSPERYTVEMPEEGGAEKDITLELGTSVDGVVEMSDGSDPAGAKVNAGGVTAEVDADGKFHIDGVTPAQQVYVGATKEGYTAKAEQIAVKEDEPNTDVRIRLVKMGTVFGTITSARSAELRDAYVQIQPAVEENNNGNNWWQMQQAMQAWNSAEKVPVRADGSYEIRMPFASGKFQIRAAALDHDDTLSDAVAVVEGQDRYQVDLALGEGVTLRGRVLLTNTTQPVAGASVTLQSGGGRNFYGWGGQQVAIVAVTDSAGVFSVPNQSNGPYSVSATADGFVGGSKSFKLPEGNDVDIFIERSLEITGFVLLPDGSPVEGVMVSASSADAKANARGRGNRMMDAGMMSGSYYNGGGSASATTGSDGGFRLQKLKSGNYYVNVTPPWNAKANIRNTKSDPVAAGTTDFKVTVQPGLSITGSVLDPDGKGIAGLWVNVMPDPQKPGMQGRNAQTTNDGSFEVVGLVEGAYKLMVQTGWGEASEYTGAERSGVTAGEKGVEIKLERGLTIEGVVLDQEGKPAPDKSLFAQFLPDPNVKSQPRGMVSFRQGATDAEGRFVLKGLSPGKYRLSMQPMWGGGEQTSEVLTGGDGVAAGTTGLQLRLTASVSISGSVVDENNNPMKGVNVWARPKSGAGNQQAAQTDEQGEFKIQNLAPGEAYIVMANQNGLKPSQADDVLGGTSGVRLMLTKGMEVTGKLLDSGGNPMPQTYLQFRSADKKSNSGVSTGQDGTFSIAGLEQVAYEVKAYRRIVNEDGGQTGSWVDIGTINAPAKDIELRMPN